ncbi:hypothetical protein [Mycobacterium sp.]|uniref:hypothetical protein n=1 Tax=Mycobacterium sp. TaxID=1785 RepID=UPI003A8A43CD
MPETSTVPAGPLVPPSDKTSKEAPAVPGPPSPPSDKTVPAVPVAPAPSATAGQHVVPGKVQTDAGTSHPGQVVGSVAALATLGLAAAAGMSGGRRPRRH